MGNFFRVSAVILLGAAGIYIYELTGGELAPAKKATQVASTVKAVAVSRSPAARIKSRRTIDRSGPMPSRPAALDRMIKERGGSDFPVLIPPYFTQDETMAKRFDVRLRLTDDGYTSVLTLPDFDVVIYGTSRAFRRPETLRVEKQAMQNASAAETNSGSAGWRAPVRGNYVMNFEESDDGKGGSISIGLYGVDYHIEFYCHDKAVLKGNNCINEEIVQDFLAAMEPVEREKPRFRFNIGIGVGIDGSSLKAPKGTKRGGKER